jgi:2-oxoglutarate dehydrogenase E2 component (dihydrolipoamide succinyltransferase)
VFFEIKINSFRLFLYIIIIIMAIIEIKVPSVGESITEVTLGKWFKKSGDIVAVDEPICEFESDKANLEMPSEVAGKITLVAKEGDDLVIGAIIATIDTEAAASAPAAAPAAPKAEVIAPATPAAPATANYATGHPSPAAAKVMAEKNLSTTDVSGTGRDGRITKEDAIQATAKTATPAAEAPKAVAPTVTAAASPSNFARSTRREKMSRMRRTIATRLVSAKNTTAMLTTFNEVDLTEVMALRDKYQDKFVAKYGIKLGFMSLFAKACAKVLMEMPEVNAQIDGTDIIYHDYADISIAISTPTGLVVPPVHNVESMNFAEIELAIKKLAEKARAGKLTMEEMSGGTFTITNGGVFGSMMSTPIINEPQSAILGMHTIQQRAMVVNGEIKIRPMMYLALSYDHRVIDGSSSVTFLVKVKKYLEDPITLLMDI